MLKLISLKISNIFILISKILILFLLLSTSGRREFQEAVPDPLSAVVMVISVAYFAYLLLNSFWIRVHKLLKIERRFSNHRKEVDEIEQHHSC